MIDKKIKVYHGSSTAGLKVIKPKVSSHGKAYVYGSTNKSIASIHMVNHNDFQIDLSIYSIEGKKFVHLTERYKDAMTQIYKNKIGHIYTLENKNFMENKTGFSEELVSTKEVNVLKCEKFNCVYTELVNLSNVGEIKIFDYPKRPPYIPVDDTDLINKAILFYNVSGRDGVIKYCAKLHPHLKEGLYKAYGLYKGKRGLYD